MPAEVEQAIDKRSSIAAVGDLNDYVKFQMAQGMEKGGGAARRGNRDGGWPLHGPADNPGTERRPRSLSPADVARRLGVTEPDVIDIIESGQLPAKRIGLAYRIKRSELEAYLNR